MNHSEREYITLCKRLIEEKFHFENDNGTLRQRDLEYLADSIEEKSAVRLSLSTLKRLWKKDYDQMPHPSTLQALVSVLGYKDWQDFKSHQNVAPPASLAVVEKKSHPSFKRWMVLPIVLAFALLFWLIAFRADTSGKNKPVIKGPVAFTGNKTVAQGVPNTIIFNYDVSNVKADSFFFQQSWNEQEKVKLDPKEHYYSNIYYYPGFHRAKLIANDSVIKRFRVHVTTDGWLPLVRYPMMDNLPVYLKNRRPVINGALQASRNDLISSNVNVDKDFVLSYNNIREFENTYSDNFFVDTRILCDTSSSVACPGFELTIACEEHIFYLPIVKKGCERNIGIKIGEVSRDGINSDLSAFGRDLHKWQHLQIRVVNKQATIYLDEQPVYTVSFNNDFGKVVGLAFNFTGTGAIDYVRLKNGENKLVFEDEFDLPTKKSQKNARSSSTELLLKYAWLFLPRNI